MNKKMCLFTVVSVATAIYILLFLWNQQSHFKVYTDSLHGLIFNANRTLLNQKNGRNERIGQVTLPSNVGSFRGSISPNVSSQKYVIYVCLRRPRCGGWSDRQRGIVSVYLLSLVTGRRFGIIMDDPCNITHFYVPSDVNWIISAAELKNKTSVVIYDIGSRGGILTLVETGDFNQHYPQDIVYIFTDNGHVSNALARNKRKARNIPKWIKSATPVMFAKAWKTLMRPSPFLQHRLDRYLQSIGYEQRTHPLVCCHVRTGRSDTFFDDEVKMNVSNIPVLWNFLDSYVQNGSKVFMATDNQKVRTSTRQKFGGSVFDTGGSIVHIDKWKGKVSGACVGFGYAVLDQLILTKCDVIILSGSGYGARAAWLRGESKGLFEFVGKKVIPIKTAG